MVKRVLIIISKTFIGMYYDQYTGINNTLKLNFVEFYYFLSLKVPHLAVPRNQRLHSYTAYIYIPAFKAFIPLNSGHSMGQNTQTSIQNVTTQINMFPGSPENCPTFIRYLKLPKRSSSKRKNNNKAWTKGERDNEDHLKLEH